MQVLDLVLRLKDRKERLEVLKEAAQGKGNKVPVCGITTLRANAGQVLSDMEDQDAIPDK